MQKEVDRIPEERKEKLGKISGIMQKKFRNENPVKLTFICTHNSRRSHFCQVWTATLSKHFGLEGIETHSGGTEVTAFNPRAVESLRRAGFKVDDPGGENPHYEVYYNDKKEPLVCYSKRFDDPANPREEVVAVMTCSDADRNCPVVPGTDFRVTIPYEDPKVADGTPQEEQVYDERCRQIASEMYYMLSLLC